MMPGENKSPQEEGLQYDNNLKNAPSSALASLLAVIQNAERNNLSSHPQTKVSSDNNKKQIDVPGLEPSASTSITHMKEKYVWDEIMYHGNKDIIHTGRMINNTNMKESMTINRAHITDTCMHLKNKINAMKQECNVRDNQIKDLQATLMRKKASRTKSVKTICDYWRDRLTQKVEEFKKVRSVFVWLGY